MANTSSAKKAAKQNEKRRVRNLARRTAIKTSIKKAIVTIQAEDFDHLAAEKQLQDVAAKLARAKSKGVLHPNTAARKLSRLAKKLHKQAHPTG